MTIVRWSPFQDFDAIDRQMRRLFGGVDIAPAALPVALPATDVYETEGELVFELEVPGYTEKELTIEVSDHTLTVKGQRTEAKAEQEKAYRLQERLATSFERRFQLPLESDTSRIAAEFKKGVLFVHAPTVKAAMPHTVTIAAK
jgi:HSP20 family protein